MILTQLLVADRNALRLTADYPRAVAASRHWDVAEKSSKYERAHSMTRPRGHQARISMSR